MKHALYRPLCALVALALLAPMALAQRWTVQYFYDEARTALALEDLAFPSAQYGIAVGSIYEQLGPSANLKFRELLSSDGGAHWSLEPIKERPRSLFFLDESRGWMVTDDGIWFTEEAGRTWKKISEQKKPNHKLGATPPGGIIDRVWFLDPQHGFAIGLQKTVLETHDGGHSWTPLAEAAKPEANASFTAYTRIAFNGPKFGLILGEAIPPRSGDAHWLPDWLDPERASKRKQVPNLTLVLQTRDGGVTWTSSTAPLYGDVTNLRLAGPNGLNVVTFGEGFESPSEVYRLNLSTGSSALTFRESDRRILDCALFEGPRGFLAGVEPAGKLNTTPIPGKVKILTSSNLTDWTEMDVDYKAVARSLVLAGPDPRHLWAATDTGMILHLEPATTANHSR